MDEQKHVLPPTRGTGSQHDASAAVGEPDDTAHLARQDQAGAVADVARLTSTSIRDYADFREDVERLSEPGLSKKQARIIRKAIYDVIDARVRNSIVAAQAAPTQATVPQRAAVPEGWQLVPIVSTFPMDKAGNETLTEGNSYEAECCWNAMLAAAPAAPVEQSNMAGAAKGGAGEQESKKDSC